MNGHKLDRSTSVGKPSKPDCYSLTRLHVFLVWIFKLVLCYCVQGRRFGKTNVVFLIDTCVLSVYTSQAVGQAVAQPAGRCGMFWLFSGIVLTAFVFWTAV